jgi:DNA-binding MarR family transcriptional regulator
MTILEDDLHDYALDTAKAVEELRLAEAHLSRRRQTACGPSDTDRMAMRFILEGADEGREVTPSSLAQHLGMTTASVTALLDRLGRGEMIHVRQHPDDKRKRLVTPVDRSDDPDVIDPLTATIRNLSADLSDQEAELISGYLRKITDAVKRECQQ